MEEFAALAPAHQAAYRDFTMDVVRGLAKGSWTNSEVATVLRLQSGPTLDGRTNWYQNQATRVLCTSGQALIAERYVTAKYLYTESEFLEEENGEYEIEDSEYDDVLARFYRTPSSLHHTCRGFTSPETYMENFPELHETVRDFSPDLLTEKDTENFQGAN